MSLEGKLEDLSLPDIFQILNLSRRTGLLTIKKKEGEGSIVFNQGQVVYASSYNKKKLGKYLLEKTNLPNDVLENALSVQKTSNPKKLLGHILIEMKSITEDQLEDVIKAQIKDVVSEMLIWNSGSFSFELEDYSKLDVKLDDFERIFLRNGLSTQFLLLESARLRDEEEMYTAAEPHDVFHKEEPKLKDKKIEPPASAETEQTKPSRKDLSLLTAMIEEISGTSGASDVTLMVLRFASEIMNRAVVFIVGKDAIRGLGQFGLNFTNGSADEKVRGIVVPLEEASLIREVIEKKSSYRGKMDHGKWNDYLINELGGLIPEEVFISPLICGDKIIAVLYGDNLPEKNRIENTEGLEAFMRVAGVALEKTLLERKLKEKS